MTQYTFKGRIGIYDIIRQKYKKSFRKKTLTTIRQVSDYEHLLIIDGPDIAMFLENIRPIFSEDECSFPRQIVEIQCSSTTLLHYNPDNDATYRRNRDKSTVHIDKKWLSGMNLSQRTRLYGFR